jgi:hypothetical protein
MNDTCKVLPFPKKNVRSSFLEETTLEEIKKKVLENKLRFVFATSEEVSEELLFKINVMGFDCESDIFEKDIILVKETVRSLMLKTMGIEHELQKAAQEIVKIDTDEEID